jgi:hypothetical protein
MFGISSKSFQKNFGMKNAAAVVRGGGGVRDDRMRLFYFIDGKGGLL